MDDEIEYEEFLTAYTKWSSMPFKDNAIKSEWNMRRRDAWKVYVELRDRYYRLQDPPFIH